MKIKVEGIISAGKGEIKFVIEDLTLQELITFTKAMAYLEKQRN